VAYRAQVRLCLLNPNRAKLDFLGQEMICFYENVSCGDAQNQVRHDAHDLALKSAVSLAVKRACTPLGDQFGLSLYNKGQLEALVIGTIIHPDGWEGEPAGHKDVQEGVPEQVSLGVDETEKGNETTEEQEKVLADTLGAKKVES
jgi:hypothetical protein